MNTPHFCRLKIPAWLPTCWIVSYDLTPGGLSLRVSRLRASAKVFAAPRESELAELSRRAAPVEREAATFEEWIEQGNDPAASAVREIQADAATAEKIIQSNGKE